MTARPGDFVIRPGRRSHALEEVVPQVYGLLAEFEDEHSLLAAAKAARAAGYTRMDAYTPFPVEGLTELLVPPVDARRPRDRMKLRQALAARDWRAVSDWFAGFNLIALLTLGGGIAGGLLGYGLQLWGMSQWYPYMNVGGRPYNSWPFYIPITYELVILFAAFTAMIAMIVLNGLPQPYHPAFNVAEFARASQDRFFLMIEAADPNFSALESAPAWEESGRTKGPSGIPASDTLGGGTRQFLESLAPGRVYEAMA